MEHMKKMIEKMRAKGKKMAPEEKKAKMSVLQDLHKEASSAMADGLKGLKKVTVASDSEEGLEHGLEKAKDIVKEMPDLAKNAMKSMGEEVEGDEHAEDKEHQMHDTYEDEEEDADQHPDAMADDADDDHNVPMHEKLSDYQDEHDDMDEEELNKRLEKLMRLKKKREQA